MTARKAITCLRAARDGADRRGKTFQGSDPLLEPPAEFRRPILEARVDAEFVRKMVSDIGIELRLAADRDEIGLPFLQDGFGLLRLQNDADGHGRDIGLFANALRKRN